MSEKCEKYSLGVYEKALPSFLTMEEKLYYIHKCGFDFLELSIDESDEKQNRLKWSDGEQMELLHLCAKYGVPIKSICLSAHRKFPLGAHDKNIRERSLEIARDAIILAEKLGVRIIQLAGYDVYYEEGDQSTRSYFEQNLRSIVSFAAQNGVVLAFETMETEFMDTVQKAMYYIERTHSPFLQIYPDIGNLSNAAIKYQCPVIEDLSCGNGHIVAAHLKETEPGKYRDMAFGTGQTDYGTCIRKLWDMGVRYYTGEFWHLGEEDWLPQLKAAFKFLQDKIEAIANEESA